MTQTPVAAQCPQIAGVFVPEVDCQRTRADLHEITVAAELLVVGDRGVEIGEGTAACTLRSQHQEAVAVAGCIGRAMQYIERTTELGRARDIDGVVGHAARKTLHLDVGDAA